MPCNIPVVEEVKDAADCKCYGAVMHAYEHMRNVPDHVAFEAALRVYRYSRSGKWRKLSKGLPGKNAYVSVLRQAMSSDECDPCGVYFGTQGGQVFASSDEGASWDLAADYLPPIFSVTAAVVE